MNRRLPPLLAALGPAGVLAVGAALGAGTNHAKPATQPSTAPATQPTTKPSADTLEHYPAPPAPPLSPEEELKTFVLAPGFRIELVASEPAVQEPVSIAFDADGRMWVAEMRGYMPDVYAHNEDAPVGRISVLEDAKGDGHFDKATVFLDDLYLPRAVMPVAGGVLVASPPHLWFCRDSKGDLHCDRKVEVSDKYGVGRDPEYGDNSPLWALDNWIYNANSAVRFRYLGGEKFESAPGGHRGQWGLAQDDIGRLYFNYNSDQLRADLIPAEYLSRNPHYKASGANVQVETDQRAWSSRPNPGINRGYEPGNLRGGRLATVTATCGATIFRGTALGPDAYGNAFIPEPSGNLVIRKTLTETDGVVMAHGIQHAGNNPGEKLDFLTSTDERFRPVNALTGPDGALYIVDLYRGVLQHKTYVTPYLRHQVFERGLEQPLHQGRIWRIVRDGAKLTPMPRMSKESPSQLVEHLSSRNGWWRDTAQRLLVETGDANSVPLLEKLAAGGARPLGRLHALWTLNGMRKLDEQTLRVALEDKDPRVCSAAIRLSEPMLMAKNAPLLDAVLNCRSRADVRLQFVLSINGVADEKAESALSALLAEAADQPYVRDAAISGMGGREIVFIRKILADEAWAKETPGRRPVLSALAGCVIREGKGAAVAQLLNSAVAQAGDFHWRQIAILEGVAAVAKAPGKPQKIMLPTEPDALLKLAGGTDKKAADLARSAIALLRWPGQPEEVKKPAPKPLDAEQQASFARGKVLFNSVCAQCHQPDGKGIEGKAPSIRDSQFILGPETRLVRIVLNGTKGEFHVPGWTPNLEMPSLSVLEDGQIADVLTYVRREWDHDAPPVDAAGVKKIRAEVGPRQSAWTEKELLAVPAGTGPATQPAHKAATKK